MATCKGHTTQASVVWIAARKLSLWPVGYLSLTWRGVTHQSQTGRLWVCLELWGPPKGFRLPIFSMDTLDKCWESKYSLKPCKIYGYAWIPWKKQSLGSPSPKMSAIQGKNWRINHVHHCSPFFTYHWSAKNFKKWPGPLHGSDLSQESSLAYSKYMTHDLVLKQYRGYHCESFSTGIYSGWDYLGQRSWSGHLVFPCLGEYHTANLLWAPAFWTN